VIGLSVDTVSDGVVRRILGNVEWRRASGLFKRKKRFEKTRLVCAHPFHNAIMLVPDPPSEHFQFPLPLPDPERGEGLSHVVLL